MRTPLDSLEIALSYRLKAMAQKQAAGDALKAGSIDKVGHDSMVRAYSAHLRKAERRVRRFRRAGRKELLDLGAELRNLRRRQNDLAAKVSKGKLSPEVANEAGRELAQNIAAIESTTARLRYVLDKGLALGDATYLNLPLDAYIVELAPSPIRGPRASPWIPLRRAVVAAGIVLAIGLAIAYGGLPTLSAGVVFNAAVLPGGNRVAVTCTNRGSKPVQFSAPWKDGTTAKDHFGIQVFVLERAASRFQYAPDTAECWAIDGRLQGRETTTRVDPNFSRRAILDSTKLHALGLNVAKVRLIFVGNGGEEMGRFEFNLPKN